MTHDVLTTTEKRADQLRESLDRRETLMRIAARQAGEAQDRAASLRDAAEAERKARGLLARLRTAWRGA